MSTGKLRLKDYRTPAFDVKSLQLDFDLHEEKTRVVSILHVKKLKEAPLVLDGENLQLISLRLDGESVAFQQTEKNLTLSQTPSEFTLEIVTEISPEKNTALEGLYVSKGILTTQCEANGFRRITYFFDRPDVMTTYQVTIRADKKKYPVLLSNGDLLESRDLGGGRHMAVWKDPFKKPCYLFALVAGPLGCLRDEFVTQSQKTVKLEIYCPHGQEYQCEHAMNSLKKAMRWDEESFGREYDLSTFMIVAIEDFNMGAMENKGLNIFNASLVFANLKTSTDQDFLRIESVVAHEYFHNWTGNRITCRDWFHLSLKEGLTVYRDQEFSSDVQDRAVQRIQDVDMLRSRQFLEDSGPNSHPVRPEEGASMDNFYTATIYEKGAEVIRMMKNWVGKKTFRKAMDLYFEKYDGQAVTIDEFTACIAEAGQLDLTHFKKWYHQSGTPQITVEEHFDLPTKTFTVHLKQLTPPTLNQSHKEALVIPLFFTLLDEDGEKISHKSADVTVNSDQQSLLLLQKDQQSFQFKNLNSKPTLSLNEDFSAPVILKQKNSRQDLIKILNKSSDGFSRREAGHNLIHQELDRLIESPQITISPDLIESWQHLISDSSLNPGLKAEVLNFPSDSVILQRYAGVDLAKIEAARNRVFKTLALELKHAWKTLFFDLPKTVGVAAAEAGIRKLECAALDYWSLSEDPQAQALLSERSFLSPFMTARLHALRLLIDRDLPFKNESLQIFKQNFEDNSVVMNKWFQVQSHSSSPLTAETVKKLTSHPLFDYKNPNRVYSLIKGFGSNTFRFFDENSDGLNWYASEIIKIDSINPQVAARLCDAYNLMPRLNLETQKRVQKSLEALKAKNLSSNVKELIERV